MPSIAILGEATTTTTLALASCWRSDDAVVVEMDPLGGSVAAWLDVPVTPSLSSVVAAIHRAVSESDRTDDLRTSRRAIIDAMIRRAPGGLRFVPCPFTAREASRAVAEAADLVIPSLTSRTRIGHRDTVLIDVGRQLPGSLPETLLSCDIVVTTHRQERASPRAAAARLERFAETVDVVAGRRSAALLDPPIALIVGDAPFDPHEIVAHIGADLVLEVLRLAEDPMSAAVLAGRTGVSERRLRRQPLLRDARVAAARLDSILRTADASDPVKQPLNDHSTVEATR